MLLMFSVTGGGDVKERRMRLKDLYLCGAAQVIVVNLLYRLEVDHSLQLGLVFVCRTEMKLWSETQTFALSQAGTEDREDPRHAERDQTLTRVQLE